MRQRVTAILVARNGGEYLERTLEALRSQTHRPEIFIAVDAASRDTSEALLAAAGPAQLISLPPRIKATFGGAIAHAVGGAPRLATGADEADSEWIWLLAHDSAPDPRALQALLAAVEIAPSVAVAGPKIMQWERPDVIAEFGESMTRFGASVSLVAGELDQAQHDVSEDVLAVGANGMLVRRIVWEALGGFDPGLPTVDAGLDFSVRARLAGHRVVLVPDAKVAAAGGPENFGRRSVSAARQARVERSAYLHRRLVYAAAPLVVLHWLALVPLAVVRSFWQLLAKRPGFVGGEFRAAFAAAFDGTVAGARARLRRGRKLRWSAIAGLRLTVAEARERRRQVLEAQAQAPTGVPEEPRIGYLGGGGLWVAVFAAIVAVIAFGPLLGSSALTGGGLLPLSASVGELWSNVGYGWRGIGTGFLGSADPFAYVLALLGSLTFWQPSASIVVLYFLALPLASAGAWFAARRMTRNVWVPIVASVLWLLAPPFLSSLMHGHLGSAIAHILLPWLVLAVVNAAKSVPAAAAASLLLAIIVASAPVLAPALLLALIVWIVARPRGVLRLLSIPLLTAALFAPLIVEQILRGSPLALFADPGLPTTAGASSPWHLVALSPAPGLNGWTVLLAGFDSGLASPHLVVAILLAPIAIVALLALFVPGSQRSIPALSIALAGFVTAVASVHIEVTALGAESVPIWPGSGLSLFWLGLVGGIVVALEAIPKGAVSTALVLGLVTAILAVPLLGAVLQGTAPVQSSNGRIVPAVVAAEAQTDPEIGMLQLTPAADDVLLADLQRGDGTHLDEQSSVDATSRELSEGQLQLATLAGNLASRGDYDPRSDFEELYIGFIVLADLDPSAVVDLEGAEAVHKRTADSLDGSEWVTPVGETASGLLWRVATQPESAPEAQPGNLDTVQGQVFLGVQGLIALVMVLLAIPTQRRRRRFRSVSLSDEPAATFEEDHDD